MQPVVPQTETNNMASIYYSDDSSDSNFTQTSMGDDRLADSDFHNSFSDGRTIPRTERNVNLVNKLINRQVSELTYKYENDG